MRNYALVVGVDDYWSPGASLAGAVRDAVEFATWLVDSGTVPANHLILALASNAASPEPPDALLSALATADYAALCEHLERIKRMVVDTGAPADRIFFHFAGHGLSAFTGGQQEDGLCASDFKPSSPGLSLTTESIEAFFRSIPAKEQFFFYDACRDVPAAGNVRLGETPFEAPPVLPTPPQFVLKATALGSTADDADEGGTFTRSLLAGLKLGAGASKSWSPVANTYLVNWKRLCRFVAAQVGAGVLPGLDPRVPQEEGAHPADADPELARFTAETFPSVALSFRLDGAPPWPSCAVQIRQADGFDDPEEVTLIEGVGEKTLVPRTYVVRGKALAHTVQPPLYLVEAYDPQALNFALTPTPDAPGPGADMVPTSPTESAVRPDRTTPPFGAALRDVDSFDEMASVSRKMPSLDWVTNLAAEKEGPDKAMGAAPPDPVPDHAPGLAVESDDPLTMITISDAAGVALAAGARSARTDQALPIYLATATGVAGTSRREILPESDGPVRIEAPASEPDPRLAAAAALIGGGVDADGVLRTGDLPPMAGADLAAIMGLHGADLIQANAGHAPAGLLVLTIDLPGLAWRERMFGDVRIFVQQMRNETPRSPLEPIATVGGAACRQLRGPCGYAWLEQRDPNRKRRAGFKLATTMLDGRTTLCLTYRRARAFDVYQFALPRDATAEARRDIVRQAYHIQRRRQSGELTIGDPASQGLLAGDWFEPVTAAIVANLVLQLQGAAGAGSVLTLLDRGKLDVLLPVDAALLRARIAGLRGDEATETACLRTALEGRGVPLLAEMLSYAESEFRAHKFDSHASRWFLNKSNQSVRHRLWTMRREDDIKESAAPLAVAPPDLG